MQPAGKVLLVPGPGSSLPALVPALATAALHVEVLSDPARAVVAASYLLPALVVLDNASPMSWAALLRALHREPQTRALRVAVYSADPAFDVVGAIVSGACDVLTGPASASLAERVAELAMSPTAFHPSAGSGPGADAAARLLQYASRVRFSGALVQLSRGAGAPEGSASFAAGALASARFGNATGLAALASMLSLPTGSAYLVAAGAAPPARAELPPLVMGQVVEPIEVLELAEALPGEPERILVVDDEESILELVCQRLSRDGFRTRTAADGVEALEAVLEWRPDAIVSDLEMPRLDGWGLLRAVRADARIAETPVVFLSAAEVFRESLRSASAGAQAYVPKTGLKSIADQVHAVLGPRRRFAEAIAAGSAFTRVEIIGARWALEKAAFALPAGSVRVRDSWTDLEVRFSSKAITGATATSDGRPVASGAEVLEAFVAFRHGDLLAGTAPPDGNLAAGTVAELVEAAAERCGAKEAAILDRALVTARSLHIDPASAALYARHGPPTGRSVLARLAQGHTPRDILAAGPESPLDLEEALRDLVRRGVVRPD